MGCLREETDAHDDRPLRAYGMMPRELAQRVVVITGGSRGIGRATACAFAREGARVVVAARSHEALAVTAQQCEVLGAQVLVKPTDVRNPDAVNALAAAALDRFEGLHVWVNCAGVIAYGRFLDVPADVFRAVIETNLLGQVHGARAALPIFCEQRDGVLINTSSVWGRVTSPAVSAYVASKFAVRAFSESLRQELRDVPGVEVCTVLPQAVDTEIFDRAANYVGCSVRPIPPLLDAQSVACGIVQCARSPRREITYRRAGRLIEMFHSLAPNTYARVMAAVFEAGSFAAPKRDQSPGATLAARPHDEGAVSGGWKRDRRRELRGALRDALAAGARAAIKRRS